MDTCCVGWRRVVCVLDNLQHALLDRADDPARVGILCDLHDWMIGVPWRDAHRR
jgi:hypothetical protein